MRRLDRDPLRNEVFSAYVKTSGMRSVHDSAQIEQFFSSARSAINDSLSSPTFMHGQRTQAMFEAITLELGRIKMVRAEDAGGGWCEQTDIEIPDYRLVLEDGSQLLVEVKNYRATSVRKSFVYEFRKFSYVEGLRRYGEFLSTPVMVAIFWADTGIWTLNRLSDIKRSGTKGILKFTDALKTNEMAILGDYMVGTKFPLQLRLFLEDATAHADELRRGTHRFNATITDIRFSCGGREITDEREKSLAFYFMLLGKWNESETLEFDEVGKPAAILYEYNPQDDHEQGFAIVGFISEMSSKSFILSTQEQTEVARIQGPVSPGFWRQLVPDVYEPSDTLPLWLITTLPKRNNDGAAH